MAVLVQRRTAANTRRLSRAQEVEDALRREIERWQDPAVRLPSEVEIAGRYSVSRVTVREALAALARKGLILRKQGLGTFVNREALEIQARLDESIEFGDLIRLAGQHADLCCVQTHRGPTTPEIAARLAIWPETETLTVTKVFKAGGAPVILCLNVLPLSLTPVAALPKRLDQLDLAQPIYSLLSTVFGQEVAYQIAEVKPVKADRAVAKHLEVSIGAPLLYIEEVGYSQDQTPLFYAAEHYVPGLLRFRLVRKPLWLKE